MKTFSCENLSFCFGKKILFKDLNLAINEPKIIALVGENGVGKTTLLKLLAGYLSPLEGKVISSGKRAAMINLNSFYPYLTIYENLKTFAYIFNLDKTNIDKIITKCKLNEYEDVKYKNCSQGTKMKALIAKCLMQEADIYIFDEPFNALDPSYIIYLKKLIVRLKEDGKIVIISSHIIRELDDIATEVWHLNRQKLAVYDIKDIEHIEYLFGENYEIS